MVKHLVNLDALIMREDFDVEGDGEHSVVSQTNLSMNIFELEKERFTRESLRKPDFQRETVDWIPEKIAGLVESFVTGDVVPSIILWRSPKSANVFVIDGAHRLSALIAWVSDDFGDGEASRRFFQDIIPPEQQAAADDTRRRIEEGIGSYESLRTPGATSLEQQQHAKNLVACGISLQWVGGDAKKAEESYFKINQGATLIDRTELRMIKGRHKANVLATSGPTS